MHIKLTVEIDEADTDVLAQALAVAKNLSDAKKAKEAELPKAVQINAGDLPTLTEVQKAELEAARTALLQVPEIPEEPEPQPEQKTESESEAEETPEPEPESEPQQEPAPEPDPVQEPDPQPELEPAAKSSMTLSELRKKFTSISKEYPGARQKVSEILVAAGARSLPSLPEDKYDWALAELEAWVRNQNPEDKIA